MLQDNELKRSSEMAFRDSWALGFGKEGNVTVVLTGGNFPGTLLCFWIFLPNDGDLLGERSPVNGELAQPFTNRPMAGFCCSNAFVKD